MPAFTAQCSAVHLFAVQQSLLSPSSAGMPRHIYTSCFSPSCAPSFGQVWTSKLGNKTSPTPPEAPQSSVALAARDTHQLTTPATMPSLKSHLPTSLLRPLQKPIYTGPSPTSSAHAPLPTPIKTIVLAAWDTHDFGASSDALADWLNARWRKSGYCVSRETVCFVLRSSGRDARMGLGDVVGGGAFVRKGDAGWGDGEGVLWLGEWEEELELGCSAVMVGRKGR